METSKEDAGKKPLADHIEARLRALWRRWSTPSPKASVLGNKRVLLVEDARQIHLIPVDSILSSGSIRCGTDGAVHVGTVDLQYADSDTAKRAFARIVRCLCTLDADEGRKRHVGARGGALMGAFAIAVIALFAFSQVPAPSRPVLDGVAARMANDPAFTPPDPRDMAFPDLRALRQQIIDSAQTAGNAGGVESADGDLAGFGLSGTDPVLTGAATAPGCDPTLAFKVAP